MPTRCWKTSNWLRPSEDDNRAPRGAVSACRPAPGNCSIEARAVRQVAVFLPMHFFVLERLHDRFASRIVPACGWLFIRAVSAPE
jgi:hypothetical protein